LYVWAEFLSAEQYSKSSKLGQRLLWEEIESKFARTRANPFHPWYTGEISKSVEEKSIRSSGCIKFDIKSNKGGWNYTFVSNKHSSNKPHCMAVYVFVKCGYEYECIGVHKSPEFTIYCRTKPKFRDLMLKAREEKNPAVNHSSNATEIESPEAKVYYPTENVSTQPAFIKNRELLGDMEFLIAAESFEANYSSTTSNESQENAEPSTDYGSLDNPYDEAFMHTLEQFLQEEDGDCCGQNSDGPVNPPANERFDSLNRRKRGTSDSRASKFSSSQFDFGKIPDILPPVPIKSIHTAIQGSLAQVDIPFEVLPLFGSKDNVDKRQMNTRKELWRLCVILTVLDSHWRTYEELFPQEYANSDVASNRPSSYEDEVVKRAFIAVAKAFGSLLYQKRIYEIIGNTKTLCERETAYLYITLKHVESALAPIDFNLRLFMNLFILPPSPEVLESAKKRVRSLNSFLNKDLRSGSGLHSKNSFEQSALTSDTESFSQRTRQDKNQHHFKVEKKSEMFFSPAGYWKFDAATLDALEYIRSNFLKTSWPMRKVYRFLEREIKICIINENELSLATGHGMMSGYETNIIIDGCKRKFAAGDQDHGIPIFRPHALVYRAFWQDNVLNFETFFGLQQNVMLFRRWWLPDNRMSKEDPPILKFSCGYASCKDGSEKFETEYEYIGNTIKQDHWSES